MTFKNKTNLIYGFIFPSFAIDSARGIFYVQTNDEAPWARG
jgi:hypothetical protein